MTGDPVQSEAFEDKVFLFLVLGVSLAFLWILRPYAGAILWGTVLAIVFAPLNRNLRNRMRRRSVAAATTLLLIVVLVLFPVALIVQSLIEEGTDRLRPPPVGRPGRGGLVPAALRRAAGLAG